jgi:regulator of nonsense transcripts 1
MLKIAANEFVAAFASNMSRDAIPSISSPEEARLLLVQLLRSEQQAISEYELFNIALSLSKKHNVDLRPFLPHLNYGALTTAQKYSVSAALELSKTEEPGLWNSLFRSDILTPQDLYQRALDQPFSLQRLYSTRVHGTATFFTYLKIATQEYTRKLIIIQVFMSLLSYLV